MDEYNKTVKLYNQICNDRDHHTFWSENIVEATQDLKDPIAWQNFYAYLANDQHKFTLKQGVTLGEAMLSDSFADPYANTKFKCKEFKNGNVTIIKMTPENFDTNNKIDNGEPLVNISEKLQIEAQGTVSERCDEKSEC